MILRVMCRDGGHEEWSYKAWNTAYYSSRESLSGAMHLLIHDGCREDTDEDWWLEKVIEPCE